MSIRVKEAEFECFFAATTAVNPCAKVWLLCAHYEPQPLVKREILAILEEGFGNRPARFWRTSWSIPSNYFESESATAAAQITKPNAILFHRSAMLYQRLSILSSVAPIK